MCEQTRAAMESPGARKADAIPKRRIFMMGNGKAVRPSMAKLFCGVVVEDCLDSTLAAKVADLEFALGFAACFDAIARGTISLVAYPSDVVAQAYSDAHNATNKANKVTNIMKELGE